MVCKNLVSSQVVLMETEYLEQSPTLLIQQTMVDEMRLDWSPNSYRETDKRTTEGELHQGG